MEERDEEEKKKTLQQLDKEIEQKERERALLGKDVVTAEDKERI